MIKKQTSSCSSSKPLTSPLQTLIKVRDCKNELWERQVYGSLYLVQATEKWEGKRGWRTVCWQTLSDRTQIFLEANTLLRSGSLRKSTLAVFVKFTSHKQPADDREFVCLWFLSVDDNRATLSQSKSPWSIRSATQFTPQKLRCMETNNATSTAA